jgi:hypothetical protein
MTYRVAIGLPGVTIQPDDNDWYDLTMSSTYIVPPQAVWVPQMHFSPGPSRVDSVVNPLSTGLTHHD